VIGVTPGILGGNATAFFLKPPAAISRRDSSSLAFTSSVNSR
jgi:hypothetical protein